MTPDRYSHWMPSTGRHAANRMDEALAYGGLLTKPPTRTSGALRFAGFVGKKESRRADSNRLPLLQLRVISQPLQGLAGDCKCRIDKPVSLLWLATRCTVLRSRW